MILLLLERRMAFPCGAGECLAKRRGGIGRAASQ